MKPKLQITAILLALITAITAITLTAIPSFAQLDPTAQIDPSDPIAKRPKLVEFDRIPRSLQLFARDENDSADVVVSGTVLAQGYHEIHLLVLKDGIPWAKRSAALEYDPPDGAPFNLTARIHAELSEYDIRVFVDNIVVAARDSIVCGDVYLINGQSNATAPDYDGLATYRNEWLRSFGTGYQSGPEVEADTTWGLAQGHTFEDHVAIGVWGLWLGDHLVETYGIPVAIINGARGGTPIVYFLRNDSDPMDLDTIYGRLLWRTAEAEVQHDVKAIIWHQGESDSYSVWIYYMERFTRLWEAWQEDYGPLPKVYVFQIHPG